LGNGFGGRDSAAFGAPGSFAAFVPFVTLTESAIRARP